MLVNIVPIGNSKGIRIPANYLKLLNIKEKVELIIEKDKILIRPVKKEARKGWAEDAKKCHKNGDDKIFDEMIDVSEDWTW